jgi:hypothetical protein
MQRTVETTMLLREHVELPNDLQLVTEAFQEGWRVVRSGNAQWLDKEIRIHGWHFVWLTDGLLRSGIGPTAEEATAHAFKLALRRLDESFDAAQVANAESSRYPGLFIARIKVYPCQIRQGASLPNGSKAAPLVMPAPRNQRVLTATEVARAVYGKGESKILSSPNSRKPAPIKEIRVAY